MGCSRTAYGKASCCSCSGGCSSEPGRGVFLDLRAVELQPERHPCTGLWVSDARHAMRRQRGVCILPEVFSLGKGCSAAGLACDGGGERWHGLRREGWVPAREKSNLRVASAAESDAGLVGVGAGVSAAAVLGAAVGLSDPALGVV